MGKRIVSSIRLDEDLIQTASVLGLNISKISAEALERAILNKLPSVTDVIPQGIMGVRDNTRVLMTDTGKFKKIAQLKAGDKVVSYNSTTERCEDANVIDVGPLTSSKSWASFWTIIDNIGTKIELLPDTKIYCWRESFSDADWLRVSDISPGYRIPPQSGYYRKGSLIGHTTIAKAEKITIAKAEKMFVSDSLFYKLEVYPNNSFFANSNVVRKLHPLSDGLPAAWGFPIKGYLGQIGTLLEYPKLQNLKHRVPKRTTKGLKR